MTNQYTDDIFNKLSFDFIRRKKILDVGCGEGTDAKVFINKYKLNTSGIDIYKHKDIKNIKGFKFKKGGINKIPHKSNSFDYIYLHDVLHHVDEKNQSYKKHISGLKELKRVCKNNGTIIILEANRFNPLSYPHMVILRGHNHFRQGYFKNIVKDVFPNVTFKHFEAHFYPQFLLKIFKIYERIMEKFAFLKPLLMYNAAIIKNDK